jgi:hypothetical protein
VRSINLDELAKSLGMAKQKVQYAGDRSFCDAINLCSAALDII